MLRGASPIENGDNILAASKFAYESSMIEGNNEYAFISFCVKFTTEQLLKTKRELMRR